MIQASQSALSQLQQQSEKPILAKFVAPHCGGCITLKPVLEQLAREHADQLHLIEIDITEEPELAIDLNVLSVPTVVLFQQEHEIGRLVGLQPKQHYTNLVQQAL
jgi:thioredoxin 1